MNKPFWENIPNSSWTPPNPNVPPTVNTSIQCHWAHFVKFVNDKEFWTKWMFQFDVHDEASYFMTSWNAALKNENRNGLFDFSKAEVSIILRDPGDTNYEHDGESLEHFFKLWADGKRV